MTEREQELYNALVEQRKAVKELFLELESKEAGDWGIINNGLMRAERTIKAYGIPQ